MLRTAKSFHATSRASRLVPRDCFYYQVARDEKWPVPAGYVPSAKIGRMQVRVLAFVLAGGKGTRLYPLTKERAKPAVPFGGRYRIIDFVLSNLINSGI